MLCPLKRLLALKNLLLGKVGPKEKASEFLITKITKHAIKFLYKFH